MSGALATFGHECFGDLGGSMASLGHECVEALVPPVPIIVDLPPVLDATVSFARLRASVAVSTASFGARTTVESD